MERSKDRRDHRESRERLVRRDYRESRERLAHRDRKASRAEKGDTGPQGPQGIQGTASATDSKLSCYGIRKSGIGCDCGETAG